MPTTVIPLTGVSDADWLAMRHPYLGASETPVLTGDGYSGSTYWNLWRTKSHPFAPGPDDMDDRLWFGRELQPVFGKWLQLRKGWDVTPARSLLVDKDRRISCTQDFWCSDPASGRERIVLETKNRDRLIFNDRYDPDANEAWVYDKIQLAQQMILSEAQYGCVAVLVGGNSMETFEYSREDLRDQIEGIPDLAADFWRKVDTHDEPSIMYSDIREWALDRGPVNETEICELDADLDETARQYAVATIELKDAKRRKEEAQGTLIQAMGKHQRAVGPTHSVKLSASLIKEAEISYVRKEAWRHTLKVEPRPATAADPLNPGPTLTVLDAG